MGKISKKQRAQYAKDILDNPVYKEAYNLVREALIQTLETSTHDQIREREAVYNKLCVLGSVRDYFEDCIINHKLELDNIE